MVRDGAIGQNVDGASEMEAPEVYDFTTVRRMNFSKEALIFIDIWRTCSIVGFEVKSLGFTVVSDIGSATIGVGLNEWGKYTIKAPYGKQFVSFPYP